MLPDCFLTETLRQHLHGASVTHILAAAIRAVEPGQAVRRFVEFSANQLTVAGRAYPLDKIRRIHLLGLGKAARAMSLPLGTLSPRGLLIPKQAFPPPWAGCEIQPGGHPVPDENSLQAGQKALEFVRGLGENDLLICLISGGGSALMTAPHPGLGLDDLQALTRALLACGARVDEINTLRRHLDQVKGGGLARAAAPAQVVSLILSDVVGNPLEAIASGPTAPDPTTRTEALGVLEKYGLTGKIPAAILKVLETAPETPKPDDPLFARVQNVLVGSNFLAAQAALAQAEAEGFQTRFLGEAWQGEARTVAKVFCSRLREEALPRPFCLVAGGETTVTLLVQVRDLHQTGTQALGGRNQELALAAVKELAGLENVLLVTLATDGEDGPTEAAGAVVSGETNQRAQALGLDAQTFLDHHDSYRFFEPLGDLLQPGPSGTNVNDLTFLFGF
jgi:hydroxypyruvate reductase